MKNGWEIKKLGEVLSIERGGSPRPIKKYLTNSSDGINWIKISDATASEKYIYETKEKITRDGLHKTRVVNEGDFILSNSMSFGRPYIMKTTGCIHDGWLVLKQNGKKLFETEFLYYLLSSPYVFQQFNYLAAGSTVRNLNIALVSSVQVPLPPITEQKRIVKILDEAFVAIDKAKINAEKNLQNSRELFDSCLESIDADKHTLGSLVNISTGKLNANAAAENGKYPFFTCSREIYAINNYAFDCEAILLAGNNASGDFNVKHYKGKFNAYQRTYVITVNNDHILYRFLYFQLLKSLREFKEKSLGVGTKFLKLGMIQELQISLPSIEEQVEIVSHLDALLSQTDKLKNNYSDKLGKLEELKKSILKKAFEGELTIDNG
jgi:type I restriction enzyme S subunit